MFNQSERLTIDFSDHVPVIAAAERPLCYLKACFAAKCWSAVGGILFCQGTHEHMIIYFFFLQVWRRFFCVILIGVCSLCVKWTEDFSQGLSCMPNLIDFFWPLSLRFTSCDWMIFNCKLRRFMYFLFSALLQMSVHTRKFAHETISTKCAWFYIDNRSKSSGLWIVYSVVNGCELAEVLEFNVGFYFA
jgi:hypothetical protein